MHGMFQPAMVYTIMPQTYSVQSTHTISKSPRGTIKSIFLTIVHLFNMCNIKANL